MAPPITLRQVSADDLPQLQELYLASAGYFTSHSGAPARPEQAAFTYADVLAAGDRAVLALWWQREHMVGCFDLRFDHPAPGTVWFGALILADALPLDRTEMAEWAVRILEEWLRIGTDTTEIRLSLLISDRAAVSFWAGMGYEAKPEALRYLIDGKSQRFVIYAKRIDRPEDR